MLGGNIIAELYGGRISNSGKYLGSGPPWYQVGERLKGYSYLGNQILTELPNTKEYKAVPDVPVFDCIEWRIEDPIVGTRFNVVRKDSASYAGSVKILEPDEQGLNVWDSDPFLETNPGQSGIPGFDDTEGYDPTAPTFFLNGWKLTTSRAHEVLHDNSLSIVDLQRSGVVALAQANISGYFATVYDGLSYPDISHGPSDDGILRIYTDAVENSHNEFVFENPIAPTPLDKGLAGTDITPEVATKRSETSDLKYNFCKGLWLKGKWPAGNTAPTAYNVAFVETAVGEDNIELAAFTLSMWANESDFDFRPKYDNGPMQLTRYGVGLYKKLSISPVDGAFDRVNRLSESPGRSTPFRGNILANIQTAVSIFKYLKYIEPSKTSRNSPSWFDIAYGYGPNKNANKPALTEHQVRSAYANVVKGRLFIYHSFLECLHSNLKSGHII